MIFKRHAYFRILERSLLKTYDIDIILKNKCYVKIGIDPNKKDVYHYLFYSIIDNSHYVLVIDEKKQEVITMLPQNSARWNVSIESYQLTQLLSIFNSKINEIIKQDKKFIPHFLSLSRNPDKTTPDQIKIFFEEKIPFIKDLLSFKDLIDINNDSLFCSIVAYLFANQDILNKKIIQEPILEESVFHVVLLNSNVTFRSQFDISQKNIDNSIILKHLQKINLNISIKDVLYIFIQNKNINTAILIPNENFFDCFIHNRKLSTVTSMTLISNSNQQISYKRFKYLNENHFTPYFLKNCLLRYINRNFFLRDLNTFEIKIFFGTNFKKYSIFNKIDT